MKKLFPEKDVPRKGLLEFLDKKGFYIVLILCIAVVGATAVFVTTHNISSPNREYSAERIIPEETDNNSAVNVEEGANTPEPIGSAAATPDNKTAASEPQKTDKAVAQNSTAKKADVKEAVKTVSKADKTSKADESVSVSSTKTVKEQEFILPVMGGVSFAFANDKLAYSKTLEEWRTHSGIDLAADRGTAVKAAADGVVTDIKSDPRFGITVIVDHQNGLKSVYSNLASDDMVSPNQKVKQGDIIGCVGNTAVFESAEQPHLHFEVLKNNEPVNPDTYLPLKN